MKTIKKILKVTGISLLILLLIALLVPLLFKKQITRLVKKEVNSSINATVDFTDASLSLFRNFPKITIVIKNLSVVGQQEFEGDTLVYAKRTEATAGIFNLIKGEDIKIYNASLQSPRIHAWMNKDGKANWDIAKESSDTATSPDTTTSAFTMSLKSYSIHNGYIVYEDEQSGTYTKWQGVDHKGSGDFTADEFTLSTVTKAQAASFIQDAIPYLRNTRTHIVADININTKTNIYTFKTDEIKLNDFALATEGAVQLLNDSSYRIDVAFNSPTNDFKNILSLIPDMYKQDFDKLNASGEAAFNGFVKGIYSPVQLPAYDVNLTIKNGAFQYPGLPKSVKNIQLDLKASNPDGLPDNAILNVSKGHLEMDKEPFDFRFLFRNPETARYIDAVVKGKLDLAQVSQFIRLSGNTKLSGLVWVDAYAKGKMAALESQQGPFDAGGFFDIKNLFYSSNNFPQPVRNGNISIKLANSGGIADKTDISIPAGHIEIGNDPVDFTLRVINPVSAMNFSGNVKGRFTLDNLKQFTTLPEGTSLTGTLNSDLGFSAAKELINKGDYDKINLTGTASVHNVKYVSKDYPSGIAVAGAIAGFSPSGVSLSDFSGNYLNSQFSGNGTLHNLIGFLAKGHPLKGTLHAAVDKMNLNDWMGTEENPASSTSSSSTPFLVPANMDIVLNAKAGQVTYDKVEYNNINGSLLLNNETITLQNVKAQTLDGNIAVNGSYSTLKNKTNPAISLSYDVSSLDVQKTFTSFNTIQAIMPIGKFLAGRLNSELTMTGNLNGNMMPDLKTLTGKGNLLLIEGVLAKFAPLEKVAATLQIDRLKSISVRDIKNYFEFANGKVLVKPFDIKVDDITMQIGGTHGFDQTMEYIIGMKVPRKHLGASGNNLINGLITSANNKGIPLKVGDMVSLNIKLTGSLTSPSIKVDLEEVAGSVIESIEEQAIDFAKEKADSVKQVLKDTLSSITDKAKDTLKQKLKEQIFGKDTTKKTEQPADSSSKKKEESGIKNKIKDILNKKNK